jgi:hypothetical protein
MSNKFLELFWQCEKLILRGKKEEEEAFNEYNFNSSRDIVKMKKIRKKR